MADLDDCTIAGTELAELVADIATELDRVDGEDQDQDLVIKVEALLVAKLDGLQLPALEQFADRVLREASAPADSPFADTGAATGFAADEVGLYHPCFARCSAFNPSSCRSLRCTRHPSPSCLNAYWVPTASAEVCACGNFILPKFKIASTLILPDALGSGDHPKAIFGDIEMAAGCLRLCCLRVQLSQAKVLARNAAKMKLDRR